MRARIPRGSLLNAATVAAGATVGALVREGLDPAYREIALGGLGLVTCCLGIKLFLQSRSLLIVAASVALGGMLGYALGVQAGIESFAAWAKVALGAQGEDRFTEGLVGASILFCVGPMTLLGCIQDGLEGKSELLALKSVMDGIAAVFFAAAMGWGVFVSAFVVLAVQGLLTVLAGSLRSVADDRDLLAEIEGAGGVILFAIGLGLLEIKRLRTADFLPALALAPAAVALGRRIKAR